MLICAAFLFCAVVGYTTRNVPAGAFRMIGVQLTDVGAATSIPVQKFITGIKGTVSYYDEGWDNLAPQIQVMDADGYYTEKYYYITDAYDLKLDDGTVYEGWADIGGNYVTDATFTPGMCVWFKAADKCTITTAGQVFEGSAVSKTFPKGTFRMAANKKPVALDLNNSEQVTYTGLTGASYYDEGWDNLAPQIQVMDADGYYTEKYYYLTDAYDLEKDDGTTYEGWADIGGNYVHSAIAPGYGFWVKATTGEFTMTFAK